MIVVASCADWFKNLGAESVYLSDLRVGANMKFQADVSILEGGNTARERRSFFGVTAKDEPSRSPSPKYSPPLHKTNAWSAGAVG